MAKVILYGAFFKHMVVRKKQQMFNPRSHGVSDITLPIHSVVHYLPKNNTELGPPPSESFISNYPTENIFINFVEGYETPVGKYRTVPFEVRKAINKYRGSHFNYSWTRNTDLIYSKRDNLIVWNHALAKQGIRQKQSLFNSYENYYNDMVNLVNQINAVAAKPFKRQQFIKVELPNQLPAFNKLLTDFKHFEKMKSEVTEENPHGFEIRREVIKNTKGEECYWLLDLLAFLYKDVEENKDGNLPLSVFSGLTEEAKANLNIIFTYQSECIIFNLGLLESWYKEVKQEAQRLNAYKRLYISFIKLSNNTGAIIETSKEETQSEEERNTDIDVEDTEETSDDSVGDILDVFAMAEQDSDELDEGPIPEGGPDNTGQVSVSWTDEVDEELLEEAEVKEIETTVNKDKFNSLTSGIERSLVNKAKEGSLTTKEQKFFMDKAETYKSLTLGNGQTIEEFIKFNPEDLTKLKENSVVTGNFNTVNDEGLKRARSTELRKGYVEKFYHKDLLHCLIGFQHSGIAISNLEISEYADKESEYEEYRVQFHPVGGSPSTRPIKMPKINKHGNFRINGVNSVLKNQRMELPIRKTAPDTVIMTSYYDKKLIVKRSPNVADNYGLWLIKQILNSKNPELSFSLGGTRAKGFETPYYYNLLSSKFKSITINGMTLSFELKRLLKDQPELKKQFSKDKAYLGVKGENVITMDRDGIISCGDDSWDLPELLKINTLKAPVEFVNINLNGYKYPIGVLLSFYFGFDDLIKLTKAKYRSVPPTERLKLTNNEYAIKFNDETLVFDRNDRFNSLIFGGLTKFKGTANFNRVDLNNSGVWLPLINDPKVKSNHFTEFDNLLRLFIDPITKEELKRLKYSVDFDHLLLDAVGLLVHNNHKHEVDITEQRIVGYERFAGHLYRELCRENRLYQNRPGGKRVFSVAPDAIINNIITDTSVNQVEETNLIHQLKDQEEMTFAGVGGRVDTAMVASTREQLDSYKGIVSEGHKDSQKVGYVTYGSSDTNLADYRGNISTDKVEDTNLLSVAGNLYSAAWFWFNGTHVKE